jgi:cation:H+ antiporter
LKPWKNKGFEGTVLGTLIMPYASGFSNLMFAFVAILGRLPKGVGLILTGAYGFFLYKGLIN